MRIACLQFAPQLCKVKENIAHTDALIEASDPQNIDILVLPELAFTGYNFPSLEAIAPYLEPTGTGSSTLWAKTTASRLNCIVTVGYPEIASPSTASSPLIAYNSTVTVSPTGKILAHYRKTHLYYTDETWAQESPTGWLTTSLPLISTPSKGSVDATFGICMDLNPRRFLTSYSAYEFSTYALTSKTDILLLSMAWLTNSPSESLQSAPMEPDIDTLGYWLGRLQPLVQDAGKEVIVVVANRCGEEERDARYAGTSWVGRVGGGKAQIWEMAGRAEERLLIVDTDEPMKWMARLGGRKEGGDSREEDGV